MYNSFFVISNQFSLNCLKLFAVELGLYVPRLYTDTPELFASNLYDTYDFNFYTPKLIILSNRVLLGASSAAR